VPESLDAVKRLAGGLTLLVAVLVTIYVASEVVRTLRTLTVVERERDTWQRPDDILRQLALTPGETVVDLGAGAGYFALKVAPQVAPNGQVLAVDVRRLSLAFLWIRARQGGHSNLRVIHSRVDDPMLPPGPIDAVLLANTYHELTSPATILKPVFAAMRPGARLVVVDRAPREPTDERPAAGHHEIAAAEAEAQFNQQGFHTIVRDDRFIDRPTDEGLWWLMVFRKP